MLLVLCQAYASAIPLETGPPLNMLPVERASIQELKRFTLPRYSVWDNVLFQMKNTKGIMSQPRRPPKFKAPGQSLGMNRASGAIERVNQLRGGLPFTALEKFHAKTRLPMSRVAELVKIAPSTLHRRKSQKRLAPEESERLFRIAQVFEKATDLFEGDSVGAMRWLQSPHDALEGHSPLELARSEFGAREVENLIGRLEHGVFS
jgi:putative toxin-antitoxin system antitoxin component (TIGR02293 family)